MASVLADLALESEAATTLAMRLAGAADRAARGDAAEAALLRIALPAAKYWVCKRAPLHAAEALECLGGNGYVEESGMPRLYREAPLNSIWEGSGNVTALDVLRALAAPAGRRLTPCWPSWPSPPARTRGWTRRSARLRPALRRPGQPGPGRRRRPRAARAWPAAITVALQAALLVRHAPAAVADAFCASRLGSGGAGRARGPVRHAAGRAGHRPTILDRVAAGAAGKVGRCASGRELPIRSVRRGTARAPTSRCSPRSPTRWSCACSTGDEHCRSAPRRGSR